MKFQSLRSCLAGLLALGTTLLLTACGGGGAGGNPNQGGPISVSPTTGTFYAGVPSRMTLQGGRKPYSMTSSEPGVLPVPAIVNDNFVDVIPNNPGVVDANLQPGDLPRRTVLVSVRDTTGILVTASIAVGQNFLTGYGLSLTPTNCPGSGATGGPTFAACPGGRTAARMSAVFNGSLQGNRQFRYSVISGTFTVADPVTGLSGQSVVLVSDHDGVVTGFIDVPANAKVSLAVIRVTDVATGVYADQVFVIGGNSPNAANPLTVIPATVSFTGTLASRCGVGNADVLVFDGVPPYRATSTDASVLVTPSTTSTVPGRFTISVLKEVPPCVSNASVVITDSTGTPAGRVVVTADSQLGTGTLPALVVAPTTITLLCGSSGSVSVVGGTGAYTVNSTSPTVTAVSLGNTIQIARGGNGLPGVGTQTTTISVTDGTTIGTVTVTSPATCP